MPGPGAPFMPSTLFSIRRSFTGCYQDILYT
jgi:hypothetical protein